MAEKGLIFDHKENTFSDFETWPLNPWTLTDLGPLTAQADLNGDGLEDFFVGSASKQAGAVFLQTATGAFRSTSASVFENDKLYEDHGALFFDVDSDRDLDLFVLSGGAEASNDLLGNAASTSTTEKAISQNQMTDYPPTKSWASE